PEGAEPEQIEGRVEAVQLAVDQEAHPGLAPAQLVGQPELADQADQLGVAVEDAGVVAVDAPPVMLEVRAEPAELPRGLEDHRTVSRLGEEVGGGEPGDAAADHGDAQRTPAATDEPQREPLVRSRAAWAGGRPPPSRSGSRSSDRALPAFTMPPAPGNRRACGRR